jgi:hypothetical protein
LQQRHQPLRGTVVAQHLGREAAYVVEHRGVREPLGEQRSEAEPLQRVGDDDRRLGGVGIAVEPHVARDRDDHPRPALGLGDQCDVVVAVDLGQVAQLGLGEARLRHQEAPLDRLVGQPVEAVLELLLVAGLDRPDRHPRSVLEDVTCDHGYKCDGRDGRRQCRPSQSGTS